MDVLPKDKKGNILPEDQGMVKHTLPREALPTDEEFESEEKLLAWAKSAGVLHQALQAGITSRIIDYRAIFKAMPSKEEQAKGIEWTPEYGQEAVDAAEWKVTKRPSEGGSKAVSAAVLKKGRETVAAMRAAKVKKTMIEETVRSVYSKAEADAICDGEEVKIIGIMEHIEPCGIHSGDSSNIS
jgi:hypothetical protein